MLLIVIGLCLFEVITSIDNAIINVRVLATTDWNIDEGFLDFKVVFIALGLRKVCDIVLSEANYPGKMQI